MKLHISIGFFVNHLRLVCLLGGVFLVSIACVTVVCFVMYRNRTAFAMSAMSNRFVLNGQQTNKQTNKNKQTKIKSSSTPLFAYLQLLSASWWIHNNFNNPENNNKNNHPTNPNGEHSQLFYNWICYAMCCVCMCVLFFSFKMFLFVGRTRKMRCGCVCYWCILCYFYC